MPRFVLTIFSIFLLCGCLTTSDNPGSYENPIPQSKRTAGAFKVGNPYRIAGRQYIPRETYSFSETGVASWYGMQFHGKKTANGETFDMNELTAAHRTLQLPSIVRVTNLENGRSLIVRVNDRGPFKKGRIIDLSKKAAELLGYVGQGTAKVKLQVMAKESKQVAEAAKRGEDVRGIEVALNERQRATPQPVKRIPPASQQANNVGIQPVNAEPLEKIPGHIKQGVFLPDPVVKQVPVGISQMYVQVASLSDQAKAMSLADKIVPLGRSKIVPVIVNGTQFYRIRVGPVENVSGADMLLDKLSNAGYRDSFIVVEE